MRIEIKPSALAHGITADEIRSVINQGTVFSLNPRRAGSVPFLYVAPAAVNEPWVELIADHALVGVRVVFHAMMLRPSTVAALGHVGQALNPEYGTQRR